MQTDSDAKAIDIDNGQLVQNLHKIINRLSDDHTALDSMNLKEIEVLEQQLQPTLSRIAARKAAIHRSDDDVQEQKRIRLL